MCRYVGQIGVTQHRPDRRRLSAGQIQRRRWSRTARTAAGVLATCDRNVWSTTKPSRRRRRRAPARRQRTCPNAAVPSPRSRGSRDAGGEAADPRLREGVGGARRRVDERVCAHRGGCGLASVDAVHRSGAGVVVEKEPAAADAGRERLGHAERGGGGDAASTALPPRAGHRARRGWRRRRRSPRPRRTRSPPVPSGTWVRSTVPPTPAEPAKR